VFGAQGRNGAAELKIVLVCLLKRIAGRRQVYRIGAMLNTALKLVGVALAADGATAGTHISVLGDDAVRLLETVLHSVPVVRKRSLCLLAGRRAHV